MALEHENFVVVFNEKVGGAKIEDNIKTEVIKEQLQHAYPQYNIDVQHG